jgi:hypothetical protein
MKEISHLEDIGVHGRIILEAILKEYGSECVDWTDLSQDRDKWRVVLCAKVKLLLL